MRMTYYCRLRPICGFLLYLLVFVSASVYSQSENRGNPKLVVGIVVDQMRYDQLHKYASRFTDDGFMRLLNDGFSFENTNYNYIPTVTAAGHASIYTGATPAVHGIIDNSWFDRENNEMRDNVSDEEVMIVGSREENANGVSPRNLKSNTITDQLRMNSQFSSKVISVSLKDRGAILPGGHAANGAYWHDWKTSPGYFVTSTHYLNELPSWVLAFNRKERSNTYLNNTWTTLYDINSYTSSAADDNPYESDLRGQGKPTFPYDFKSIRETFRERGNEYQLIWVSPYGNTLLTEFAIEALKGEELGQDVVTDFLCISYSVTDVIGHTFGPQSVEIEDIYLRLDRDIALLLKELDNRVGRDNYLVFLTSDHGVNQVPAFRKDHKLPSGIANTDRYKAALARSFSQRYGSNELILDFSGFNVYLDNSVIIENDLNPETLRKQAADFLMTQPGISLALTSDQLRANPYTEGIRKKLQNGYHPSRSGDILLVYDPGYVPNIQGITRPEQVKGAVHGSGYAYDSHVPMIWYGKGIPQGSSVRPVSVTDIAPTLALWLKLQLPGGAMGQPLTELFAK